jgi:hypothetical protein
VADTPNRFNAWLRPLWVRVLIIVFCAGWTAWEWLVNRDQFWGMITLAATGWGIWELIVNFEKKYGAPPDGTPKS